MIGLDTNVWVRYLVQDHPEQAREATEVIEGAEAAGERLFVSSPVLCELVWVLERAYRLPRPAIAGALETLLHLRALVVEHKDEVARALDAYRTGPAGFADYLIVRHAWSAGCKRFVTFDKALAASLPDA